MVLGTLCGARVLEVFSCRKMRSACSWEAFPTADSGSLWPWSDDFSGEPRGPHRLPKYSAWNSPMIGYSVQYRSVKTTLKTAPKGPHVRLSFEVEPATDGDDGQQVSPYPSQCPRCQNYRSPRGEREIVDPMRTRGPSFHFRRDGGHAACPAGHHGGKKYWRPQGPRLLGLSAGCGAARRRPKERPSV